MNRPDANALLIAGGGLAALTAARASREGNGPGWIGIGTDERRVPYLRPALSEGLLRGEVSEAESRLESERWPGEHDVAPIGGACCQSPCENTNPRTSRRLGERL